MINLETKKELEIIHNIWISLLKQTNMRRFFLAWFCDWTSHLEGLPSLCSATKQAKNVNNFNTKLVRLDYIHHVLLHKLMGAKLCPR